IGGKGARVRRADAEEAKGSVFSGNANENEGGDFFLVHPVANARIGSRIKDNEWRGLFDDGLSPLSLGRNPGVALEKLVSEPDDGADEKRTRIGGAFEEIDHAVARAEAFDEMAEHAFEGFMHAKRLGGFGGNEGEAAQLFV